MEEIKELLQAYPEAVISMTLKLRQLILKQLPGIIEIPDFPARLIGYGYGSGYKHIVCSIILSQKGIKLGFWQATALPDPDKLLKGTGKVHKYVEIRSVDETDNPALEELLVAAKKAHYKEPLLS